MNEQVCSIPIQGTGPSLSHLKHQAMMWLDPCMLTCYQAAFTKLCLPSRVLLCCPHSCSSVHAARAAVAELCSSTQVNKAF